MKNQIPRELDELCIEVGKFIEYWGFKEIEGRLWCHLLLANKPLCPQDLMDRTGVSKGLVSISIARLLEYEVIRHEYTKGRRTQYFQINENITDVIQNVLRSRERKMISGIQKAVDLLGGLPKEQLQDINLKRIAFLQKMVKTASNYLEILIFGGGKISNFIFDKAPLIKVEKETLSP